MEKNMIRMIFLIPERKIHNVKVGDVLNLKTEIPGESGKPRIKTEEYCVEAVYPFHIRAFNGNVKKCFSIGDLVLAGIEPSMV